MKTSFKHLLMASALFLPLSFTAVAHATSYNTGPLGSDGTNVPSSEPQTFQEQENLPNQADVIPDPDTTSTTLSSEAGIDSQNGMTSQKTIAEQEAARNRTTVESRAAINSPAMTNTTVLGEQTAGDLTGKAIYDSDNRRIARIDQIVTDPQTGETFAVIEHGGFLGLGEREKLVPLSHLSVGTKGILLPGDGSRVATYQSFRTGSYNTVDSDQNLNAIAPASGQ